MVSVDTEVLIVGAGLAGGTLAGLLGKAGVDCILLDTGSSRGEKANNRIDPRVLAITPASARILQSFDLWRHLPDECIGHFRSMYIWDENSKGEVQFDSANICVSTLGYIIEQTVIQEALDKMLSSSSIVDTQRSIAVNRLRIEQDKTTVILDNDRQLTAKLIVAADGTQSKTRELAGVDYKLHEYKQHAVTCVVDTALNHDQVARQKFMGDGPLAFLPMVKSNKSAVVWSTTPGNAQYLLQLEEEAFKANLQTAFDHTLGDIMHSGPRAAFPLMRAQAAHYCQHRLVLIGDAAHSVHPLAGQGANLGLLDAACLFEVIQNAREKKKDVGAQHILRGYERWRKGENKFMMMMLEGFKYLFEMQQYSVPMLRNTGMGIFNNFDFLKQQVMKRAMGLEGDLPEIAKVF